MKPENIDKVKALASKIKTMNLTENNRDYISEQARELTEFLNPTTKGIGYLGDIIWYYETEFELCIL